MSASNEPRTLDVQVMAVGRPGPPRVRTLAGVLSTVSLALCLAPHGGSAQEALCADAHAFLVDDMGMSAITEADSVDDWRTGRVTAGCRVTAAGLTDFSLREQARAFFERLRALDWMRTPDPRDAPNEASLRFRRHAVDCLFSFYSGGLLGTEAEAAVDDTRVPATGQLRFNYLVQCVPAAPARPRNGGSRPWPAAENTGPLR